MSNSALREWREKNGFSQEAAAKFLGWSRMTYIRWETGRRRPNAEQTRAICDKTGLPARLIRPDFAELLES